MYDAIVAAIRSGDSARVAELLSTGHESPAGKPSLTWVAAASNQPECLELLARGDPESLRATGQGLSPATQAASAGNVAVIEVIAQIDPRALAAPDITGQSVVHHAAANGHSAVLAICARAVPDALDTPSKTGMTAMDLAWNLGFADCVQVLADAGIETVADKWSCGCSPGQACGPDGTGVD